MSSAARTPELIGRNRLASLLFKQGQCCLNREMIVVSLPKEKQLYDVGEPIDAIYFPLDAVVSVLAPSADGKDDAAELALIGNEGGAGVFSHVSADRAIGPHVVEIPGDALRLDSARFDEHLDGNQEARLIVGRYSFALVHQINVTARCNQTHGIQQRCARWLLMVHDRVGRSTFGITQEYLARMLAVRRATVNEATAALKAKGAIRYSRGQMTVADRGALEAAVCPCYERTRRAYAAFGLA